MDKSGTLRYILLTKPCKMPARHLMHRTANVAPFFLCYIFITELVSAAQAASSGVTYDLSRDFSTNSNPAGLWSYGWKSTLGGPFSLLTISRPAGSDNGVQLWLWFKEPAPAAVYFNPSSSTATSDQGQGVFPPGTVWYYPGIEGNPDNFGVIRFTVPPGHTGNYQLDNAVQSYLDGPGAGDTDYHIVHNGVEIFGQFLAPRAATGFTNVLTLAGGDTLDFAIGRGADESVHGSGLKINATLTFLSTNPLPPSILAHPQSQTAYVGEDATFSVAVVGSPPLFYHWLYNGTARAGATESSLVLRNVQLPDAGYYSVIISNASGAVTSQVAELTVLVPPPAVILRGPYLQSATMSNIIVKWRTDRAVDSKVIFGETAEELSSDVTDAAPKTEHAVLLSNLRPGTRYYYAVGTGTNVLVGGADYYFRTLPPSPEPTRIWVLGDSGTAASRRDPFLVRDAYYQWTGNRYTDVWLMLGDNAYGVGTDAEYQVAVFEVYQDMLRQTALWSTIGNHETYAPDHQGNIAYTDIFSLPTDGRGGGVPSGTERYYSFNYGNIHFVCLDSELSDKQPGGTMLTWLEQDLSANTNEWVIAFWHTPPYTKGSHNSDDPFDSGGFLIQMRENVVPVLESHGVDLVLCGHSHSYERSYLMDGHYGFSQTIQPSMIKDSGSGRPDDTGAYLKFASGSPGRQGAVYVVAGSSGQTSGGFLNHPAMFISLNRLGSLIIDVDGQRLDAKFLRETGSIDDYFSIIKGLTPEPLRLATFRVSQGSLVVAFKSVAGGIYRIQKTPQLHNPQWTDVSEDIIATGATTRWSGPIPGGDRQFFRVVQR